jgi:WD40-like Beta Propeller Repeat
MTSEQAAKLVGAERPNRRRRVAWLAAVLAVATAALVAPSSNAMFRATNGLLAYQASVGKHPHRHSGIFTVQPDGSHVRQLTHFGDSSAAMPDWSPDGRKIVFTRYWGELGPPESFQILTMNADGSAMRAVTSRGLDDEPATSPTAASSTSGAARTSGSSPTPTAPTFEAQRFTSAGPRCAYRRRGIESR